MVAERCPPGAEDIGPGESGLRHQASDLRKRRKDTATFRNDGEPKYDLVRWFRVGAAVAASPKHVTDDDA